jgi:hypothetical protein
MPTGLVNVAFNDSVLEVSPSWTRLDYTYKVMSITVDRGRSFELDTTNTGTCRIRIADTDGSFDPTYTGGTFYGQLDPYKQVAISLPASSGSSWATVFRGYVSNWQYELHPSKNMGFVTIDCVDLMDYLAGAELSADGSFGSSVSSAGDIVYDAITATTGVQTRITQVLNEVAAECGLVSWPSGLRNIYTGNVGLFARTYTTRTSALTVIQEAAEAEFPGGVANFYVSKDGVASFRGRYARFDYTNSTYSVDEWALGDDDAADASPSTVVPVSPPLVFSRDKENIFTAASAVPTTTAALVELTSSDRAANYVVNATAAGVYGLRTWAAEDLATRNGAGATTALQETNLFADYYLANYAAPRTRVGALTVRPQRPTGSHGSATWALLQGVELGDYLELNTTHVAGGFSSTPFFVEGIHYEIVPMTATHPEVTLTLDVSPQSYWTTNPFAG